MFTPTPGFMPKNLDYYVKPKTPRKRPVGNDLIPYGSPLHAVELFLQILKMTFSELPDEHPYKFVADDFDKSGIAFDVALNKESGIYGKKPLIVVSRAAQSASVAMIGDYAKGSFSIPGPMPPPSATMAPNTIAGSNLAQSGINVVIASRVKAEVEVLAQMVFGIMIICRTHMPNLLGIHMVQSITLSEVDKYEEDDTMFIGQAQMQYYTQYKWAQTVIEPILRKVLLNVSAREEK